MVNNNKTERETIKLKIRMLKSLRNFLVVRTDIMNVLLMKLKRDIMLYLKLYSSLEVNRTIP
jgi:hypothetical protein